MAGNVCCVETIPATSTIKVKMAENTKGEGR
jgi:hypothetical protein